jgi:hypothetical protein
VPDDKEPVRGWAQRESDEDELRQTKRESGLEERQRHGTEEEVTEIEDEKCGVFA